MFRGRTWSRPKRYDQHFCGKSLVTKGRHLASQAENASSILVARSTRKSWSRACGPLAGFRRRAGVSLAIETKNRGRAHAFRPAPGPPGRRGGRHRCNHASRPLGGARSRRARARQLNGARKDQATGAGRYRGTPIRDAVWELARAEINVRRLEQNLERRDGTRKDRRGWRSSLREGRRRRHATHRVHPGVGDLLGTALGWASAHRRYPLLG